METHSYSPLLKMTCGTGWWLDALWPQCRAATVLF